MNAAQMVKEHLVWIDDLGTRLTRGEVIERSEVAQDDLCTLGRWLNSEAARLGHTEAYRKVRQTHRHFHECAAVAVDLAADGDLPAAMQQLEMGGPCQALSNQLMNESMALTDKV